MDSKCLNILAVDDAIGIRYLLSTIISEEGHNPFTAANGLEVLQVLQTVDIQLVFLDIKLPVMNGIRVLEKIRTMGRKPDVIAITGFTEKEIIDKIYKNGADSCITKPFDVNEIRRVIRDASQKNGGSANRKNTV